MSQIEIPSFPDNLLRQLSQQNIFTIAIYVEFIYDGNGCKSGIYKITNKSNNRFYIGSTNIFKIRWNKHKPTWKTTDMETSTYKQISIYLVQMFSFLKFWKQQKPKQKKKDCCLKKNILINILTRANSAITWLKKPVPQKVVHWKIQKRQTEKGPSLRKDLGQRLHIWNW